MNKNANKMYIRCMHLNWIHHSRWMEVWILHEEGNHEPWHHSVVALCNLLMAWIVKTRLHIDTFWILYWWERHAFGLPFETLWHSVKSLKLVYAICWINNSKINVKKKTKMRYRISEKNRPNNPLLILKYIWIFEKIQKG